MIFKKIVLLANSRKHAGRCLAGRETDDGKILGWIRPVSDRVGEELSEKERELEDGSDPQVLDVLRVPLLNAKPHACQTENWLIDIGYYWSKIDTLNWHQASKLAEKPGTLWVNNDSTYNGKNDQILQQTAAGLSSSICFIRVNSLALHVLVPGAAWGNMKKRVQARFSFNGTDYWLWVTDPKIERTYLAGDPRVEHVGECLLTISLSEPHEKSPGIFYQYKLVAALLVCP
ncbi:hypothetical protein [Hydrogenophaga sp.]|uniref:dual OB domain-containing protein n=1 Tax=Hydrogenophaga sp. TaxID=1904254 RepID=UPI0027377292|nr:hypothetical protein [Hydrogenophaga sp.]MDP3884499.1 hypothetical protein [Hydrogenophaga sp.]